MASWRVHPGWCSVLVQVRPLTRRLGPRPLPMTSHSAQGAALSVLQLLSLPVFYAGASRPGSILPLPVSPPGLEAVFLAAGEVSSYL